MIIRIAGEGQYELTGQALVELDGADDSLLDAIQHGSEAAFAQHLGRVLDIVRTKGRRLDHRELRESDVVLPPPDMSLHEAHRLLSEYPRDLVR